MPKRFEIFPNLGEIKKEKAKRKANEQAKENQFFTALAQGNIGALQILDKHGNLEYDVRLFDTKLMNKKEVKQALKQGIMHLLDNHRFEQAEELLDNIREKNAEQIKDDPDVQKMVKEKIIETFRKDWQNYDKAQNALEYFILNEEEKNAFKQSKEMQTAAQIGASELLASDYRNKKRAFNKVVDYFDIEPELAKQAIKRAYKNLLEQGNINMANWLCQYICINKHGQYYYNENRISLKNDISEEELKSVEGQLKDEFEKDEEIKKAAFQSLIESLRKGDLRQKKSLIDQFIGMDQFLRLRYKTEIQKAMQDGILHLLNRNIEEDATGKKYTWNCSDAEDLFYELMDVNQNKAEALKVREDIKQAAKKMIVNLLSEGSYRKAESCARTFLAAEQDERREIIKQSLIRSAALAKSLQIIKEMMKCFTEDLELQTGSSLKQANLEEMKNKILEYYIAGKRKNKENVQQIAQKIIQEELLRDTCWNYSDERIKTENYMLSNSVINKIIMQLEKGLEPQEIAQQIEAKQKDEYSPLNFILTEQKNQKPREIADIPKINQEQIIQDMALFAEYGFLFNEQKMNLSPQLQQEILGRELVAKINKLKQQVEDLKPDEIEMEMMFNLIDFQSCLKDPERPEEQNQYSILFHGTDKQAARDIASRTGLYIGNRAKTGAYISTRSSISFEQYALSRDVISGAQEGERGGMIMFPRQALRQAHVQGVRQDLNKSNGYIVDSQGKFIRIPMEAGIDISADTREELQKNIYKTIYTIQQANKQGLDLEIQKKFAEFLSQQKDLRLKEIYQLMRAKDYPEAKIVEVRDIYIRYLLQANNGDKDAEKKFTICQKILQTYKTQDIKKLHEKTDIAMIIDIFEEYPEMLDKLKKIEEKAADDFEEDIQREMQKIQEDKFLDGIQAMRQEGQLYDQFKKRIKFLKARGLEYGLFIKDYKKLKSVMCGEINSENIQEIHQNIQEIEQDLTQMNQEILKIAEQQAWEGIEDEQRKEVLEQNTDRYCVALTGSNGRGVPSLSSDMDFIIYFNDIGLSEEETELINFYLIDFKRQIITELQNMGFIKVDAARMNAEPIIRVSTVKQLVLNLRQERQQVEPISLIESKPVDKKHKFMLEFQKALLGKSESVQEFLKEELKREKYFRWTYSVSELLSGDSIKDFKKDISRTIDWALMLIIIKRIPDEIYKIDKEIVIPADMMGKVELLKKYNVLSEQEEKTIKQIILDTARWRLRGDIVSQGADQVNFDVMMMTNRERQRFLEYAKFINNLIPAEIKEKVKEDIIIN